MLDLLRESILLVNLPFTILLGAVIIYWIIALVGVLDIDALDGLGDAGIEVDGIEADGIELDGIEADGIDGDVGAGVEAEGGVENGGSFFHAVLKIFGAADAPLIFVISLLSVFLWATNLVGNHYFNSGNSGLGGLLVAVPSLIASLVLTRIFVVPLRPVIGLLKNAEKPAEIIGSSGIVRSSRLDEEFGEVEIESSEKNLILRARVSTGSPALEKGAPILVVSCDTGSDPESSVYLVRSLD